MRPLRLLLFVSSCLIALTLLLCLAASRTQKQDSLDERSGLGAYFSWRTPSSLFPPSAIISLTDDNSTFFLARPAAFGPLLPSKSVSGQLWVGSGFGDDNLGRGGSGKGAEGELGCSDVPGWNNGEYGTIVGGNNDGYTKAKSAKMPSMEKETKDGKGKRNTDGDVEDDYESVQEEPEEDDGTDDYLHHPLPPSNGLETAGRTSSSSKKPHHADIQSLQESAEIAGKVVLLSRGGCGFLEKVKWAQRRGGVGLIVGDDIRGGPLVTMYARGDTSNVTIPSLFTSHTTAHLLSSLIPDGGYIEDMSPEQAARLGLTLGSKVLPEGGKGKSSGKKGTPINKAKFATTSVATKATSTAPSTRKYRSHKSPLREHGDETIWREKVGWFRSLFSSHSVDSGRGDSRRPPSSGRIDWVLQEDFVDEDQDEAPMKGKIGKLATTSTLHSLPTKPLGRPGGDGFVIGVQDWRDPDVVAHNEEHIQTASTSSVAIHQSSKAPTNGRLRGGSITPSSGEYNKPAHEAIDLLGAKKPAQDATGKQRDKSTKKEVSTGWLSNLWSSKSGERAERKPVVSGTKTSERVPHLDRVQKEDDHDSGDDDYLGHDGLWVTLTPTSMSSSPFFDTLLVLVVSPLVTLTVVYALLLLRSRIRRRRWRAPKSVVERLPVRTYQTMPNHSVANSSTTSSLASPASIDPTTPLLQSNARPISQARPRPRSRTASEAPVQPSSFLRSTDTPSVSLDQVEEKRAAGLAEWRRRYGGEQKECVVCLEEYVDGVSRVMSLPCGHEFHAECITPWLTTRRRTCPICKGDVVRSLARSNNSTSSSSPPPLAVPYHVEEDEDEVQELAASIRNDDPAAAEPVSREDEAFEDLELGVGVDRNR